MAKNNHLEKLRNNLSGLIEEEQKLKKELMDLKMKLSSGQLKEIHKIKEARKAIARLKTISLENFNEKSNE